MATRSKEAITDVIVMNLHVPLSLLWRSPSLLGMRPATIDTERQPNMAAVAITIEGIDAIDIAKLKYPSTNTKFKTHQTCPISTLSCLQFNWSEKNGTVERQQLLLWEISFPKDFQRYHLKAKNTWQFRHYTSIHDIWCHFCIQPEKSKTWQKTKLTNTLYKSYRTHYANKVLSQNSCKLSSRKKLPSCLGRCS